MKEIARPYILESVAFLTTRVNVPDMDDYKKLVRVNKYLKGDPETPLALETYKTPIMKWCVDPSFSVHPGTKSHMGFTMSLDKGSIYSTSIRQNINMRSSTKADLVGVDEIICMILWRNYFLESQGYSTNIEIFQDNQSSILLEKNSRIPSIKITRYIKIRYYFVLGRV